MEKSLSIAELKKRAFLSREKILDVNYLAESGHTAGALSSLDIMIALYFGGILHHDPGHPNDPKRDRFVLSCGHTCPAYYTVLAEAGYLHKDLLASLREMGSPLQGHPEKGRLPGIEVTSGLLGQGLSIGVGMALARRTSNIFVLGSDAEQQEGQIWEAVMTAAKYHLGNLIFIIDRNHIQIDGTTEQIMPLGDLKKKYEASGWIVKETDGHDFKKLIPALKQAVAIKTHPVVIIASTVAGKGVPFMEGRPEWHGKVPNKEEYYKALRSLRA